MPGGSALTDDAVAARWALPDLPASAREVLADARTLDEREAYARNIENFIGTVKLPVGLAGPLRVNGAHARGDYYVPLATTEAALVASYSRGAQLITEAGGCAAVVLNEGVTRAPGFAFETLGRRRACSSPGRRMSFEAFKTVAGGTTRHGKLVDMQLTVEGNHVMSRFEFTTGDASGQNMVTIADRRDLPLHRGAHAGAAALLVRRGEHVRRQEGDDAVVHVGARQEGQRRGRRAGGARRGAPAHDARTRWSTTGACRRSAA